MEEFISSIAMLLNAERREYICGNTITTTFAGNGAYN
jgi:hypothetical protein